MTFDVNNLICELQDICADTLLSRVQKKRFIESAVLSALSEMEPEDIPVVKATWGFYKQRLLRERDVEEDILRSNLDFFGIGEG